MSMKKTFLFAAALAVMTSTASAQTIPPSVQARIDRILKATPLIDGHNDLAEQLRENYALSIDGLASDTDKREHPLMTDMARLHAGRVRSEEHTSELQSHVNLVCRLLLEKKKK